MSVALQGIIIYWISTSALLRFSLSRSHGMETHTVIFFFPLWMLLASLLLCSGGATSLSILRAPEDIKIWVSSWPILKVNTTARPIVWIPGVFCGSPPRITLISCWSVPQLNFIRRHIVRRPRFLISGSPVLKNNFLTKWWGPSQKWMILPGP